MSGSIHLHTLRMRDLGNSMDTGTVLRPEQKLRLGNMCLLRSPS